MTQTALIYAIHRTQDWWRHVGAHLGYDRAVVLTDRRGQGDRWVTDDFYAAYRRLLKSGATQSALLDEAEVADVIARCRVLRWRKRRQAVAMLLAMAEAMERVIEAERPTAILSFPIDSYVSDLLARRARAHVIPHYELTASALPGMAMLLHRGKLITTTDRPSPAIVAAKVHELADPLFTPSYVQGQAGYTRRRFLRTIGYFRTRAEFFRVYAMLRRDRLNLHYLDAQFSLGHKPSLRDVRIVDRVEPDWRDRIATFAIEDRVFFGLQLFPEASIDYWIDDLGLVDYEDMLVEAATALTGSGFQILVKDHPLQFGFRQMALIDRLKALPNVVLVPYQVSGNEMLSLVGTSLTGTGTLGLQAALLGLKSVAAPNYYTTPDDFLLVSARSDLPSLPDRIREMPPPADLPARQARIVAKLLSGSFDGDFFSFRDFDPASPAPAAAALGAALGARMRKLGPDGEDWHERSGELLDRRAA